MANDIFTGNCGFVGALADESPLFKGRVESVVEDLRKEEYARWAATLELEGNVQVQIVITRDEADFIAAEE